MSLESGPAEITGPARTILFVQDLDAQVAFFRQKLGFPLAYPVGGDWAEFTVGGMGFCLHGGGHAGTPTAKRASIGWPVADLDAATAALRASGIEVSGPNPVTEGLRAVEFTDPEGNNLFFEGA